MTETLSYYPTGRFLQFAKNLTERYEIHVGGDKFVVVGIEGTALALACIPLHSEGGQFVSPDENKVIIPLPMQYYHMSSQLYEDKLLVTLFDVNPPESLIVVIHLDKDKQYQGPLGPRLENQGFIYQQHAGPNFQSSPMGLDGNIIYLSSREVGSSIIVGLNLETGQTEYRYATRAFVPHGKLGKMQDGTLVAPLLMPPAPDGSRVVRIMSIPDEEAILDIEGPVTLTFPRENGVLYQLYSQEFYFCTYDGGQYLININEDLATARQRLTPVTVSDNADDIWIKPRVLVDNRNIINYKLGTSHRQKSAASAYRR